MNSTHPSRLASRKSSSERHFAGKRGKSCERFIIHLRRRHSSFMRISDARNGSENEKSLSFDLFLAWIFKTVGKPLPAVACFYFAGVLLIFSAFRTDFFSLARLLKSISLESYNFTFRSSRETIFERRTRNSNNIDCLI